MKKEKKTDTRKKYIKPTLVVVTLNTKDTVLTDSFGTGSQGGYGGGPWPRI